MDWPEDGEVPGTKIAQSLTKSDKVIDNLTERHEDDSDLARDLDRDSFECFPIDQQDYHDPYRLLEDEIDADADRGCYSVTERQTLPSSGCREDEQK